ncbi:MAG: hypothetical protein ACI8ZN_001507 [Bacteroidia bacterium]|jgi:hypothetical protein
MRNLTSIVILAISFLAAFSSCNSTDETTAAKDAGIAQNVPDVKAFMQGELKRLEKEKPSLTKKSVWQDNTNDTILNDVDWKRELALFLEIDFKPAQWASDFEQVEELHFNGEHIVDYKSVNPEQRMKLVRIVRHETDSSIKRFMINFSESSVISNSTRSLSYTQNKGYTVTGSKKIRFFEAENYQIIVHFLPMSSNKN